MEQSLKYILICGIAALLPLRGVSQDMSEGFQLMEAGENQKASVYFKEVLDEYPFNKTALICYGRATGLSGNPYQALTIFNDLILKYPEDQEVLLNKAEAHLWLKEPSLAIETYQKILEMDSLSFNALLGKANSLSMAKRYKEANEMVKVAVRVAPLNTQAQLSQKYIRLAFANELASEHQRFKEALNLVEANLTSNPTDQESIMLQANISIMAGDYSQANSSYEKITNDVDKLLGISVAQHLSKNNENALALAKESLTHLNPENAIRIHTHYVSALLWNKKLHLARFYADSLVEKNPKSSAYVASQAEVAMYEADFINGYETYIKFLKQVPESFKGNLGIADASHALGMDNEAYQYAKNTLKYYPGQQDAKNFIQRLNNQHSPMMNGSIGYGKSSDGSSFSSWAALAQTSISPLTSVSLQYSEKQFNNSSERATSQTQTMRHSIKSQIGKRMKIQAALTSIKLQLTKTNSSNQMNSELMLARIMSKSQTLTFGYKSEIQDFNADLLNQKLKTSHIVTKNAMNWKRKNIGWYSEYYYSFFSDSNRRHLLFTSLYKTNEEKGIKGGMNYLTMAFKENKPLSYFSPESFHQIEVFGDANLKNQNVPFTLNLNGAVGCQFMDGQNQLSWRTKVSLEKAKGRLNISVFGAYSSIVATQTNGFSFFNCGATIKWQLTKVPIFKVR